MKIRQLAALSVLAAAAAIIHTAESYIPPLLAIPGIKLGLSNIVVLVTMYLFGKRSAFCVLVVKLLLGGFFSGQLMTLAYSTAGGFLSFLTALLLFGILSEKQIWALSAFCAVSHNAGQLLTAIAILGTGQLLWYAPVLIVSGVVTGLFTGFCAVFIIPRIKDFLEAL